MKLREPEVIYKSGKPTAVILPLAEYTEMLEQIEDAADVRWLKKARAQGMSYRPLTEYLKENPLPKKRRVSGRR